MKTKNDNETCPPLPFRKSAAFLLTAIITASTILGGCGTSVQDTSQGISGISALSQSISRQLEKLPWPSVSRLEQTNGSDASESSNTQRSSAQKAFEELTDTLFRDQVSSSLIDLHYTVTDPDALGINRPESLYGEVSLDALKADTASVKEALVALLEIRREDLTQESQLDYDILKTYLETESLADGLELYVQPLAPTIGVQAQLPILLAEYAFYSIQDVEDYLQLLTGLDDYFKQILTLEQEKANQGLMITDDAIDRILDSCRPYLETGEGCVLAGTFLERLEGIEGLTAAQKEDYISRHTDLISSAFVPAYQHLMDGMSQLKGTGTVEGGLSHYPKGKDYYRYLVYSSTATSCKNVDTLQKSIKKRINDDFKSAASLLKNQPELLEQMSAASFSLTDPVEILDYLQDAIKEEYPEPICKDYTLHYVPKALEPVLSPAFYLTPPMDRSAANPIYINQGSASAQNQLFCTLAHEGYPGHLYQSSYFVAKDPSPFRHILSFSAYNEGWATYVEYESYHMDPNLDPSAAQLLALDSAINLGIHAYLDLMVNDQGWGISEVSKYISQYFEDPDQEFATALYEAMVDNPSNYLEYYAGYLEFSDMRKRTEQALGNQFQLKEFHQFLLDIGPAPFSVIRDRLNDWIREKKQS